MINFPNKKNSISKSFVYKPKKIQSNLGMYLEDMINSSVTYYKDLNLAIIHKKPTPIKIVNVEYPSRSKAKITEAYFTIASTTDYNGIYKMKYIDFEAKETNNTAFSYNLIHEHQINHLANCKVLGGICFILILFKKYDELYLLDIDDFLIFYNKRNIVGERKSISYKDIKEKGSLVEQSFIPRIKLLNAIDEKYFS